METIITLIGKENLLADEILDIKHRIVKFKMNMIMMTKNFNRQ